jgi:riboflavin synthase
MFTGIIETTGTVIALRPEGSNLRITMESPIGSELKVDQSVAHNGVCLTVVKVDGNIYEVVAVDETLKRTNVGDWKTGTRVNLERCMKLGDRLDGHIVQGHVDTTAIVKSVEQLDGSWNFRFEYSKAAGHVTVPKGSICINGVSLTVVDSGDDYFSVTIIPYTFEHTNFGSLKVGDKVNLEFDIIGKYVARLLTSR